MMITKKKSAERDREINGEFVDYKGGRRGGRRLQQLHETGGARRWLKIWEGKGTGQRARPFPASTNASELAFPTSPFSGRKNCRGYLITKARMISLILHFIPVAAGSTSSNVLCFTSRIR